MKKMGNAKTKLKWDVEYFQFCYSERPGEIIINANIKHKWLQAISKNSYDEQELKRLERYWKYFKTRYHLFRSTNWNSQEYIKEDVFKIVPYLAACWGDDDFFRNDKDMFYLYDDKVLIMAIKNCHLSVLKFLVAEEFTPTHVLENGLNLCFEECKKSCCQSAYQCCNHSKVLDFFLSNPQKDFFWDRVLESAMTNQLLYAIESIYLQANKNDDDGNLKKRTALQKAMELGDVQITNCLCLLMPQNRLVSALLNENTDKVDLLDPDAESVRECCTRILKEIKPGAHFFQANKNGVTLLEIMLLNCLDDEYIDNFVQDIVKQPQVFQHSLNLAKNKPQVLQIFKKKLIQIWHQAASHGGLQNLQVLSELLPLDIFCQTDQGGQTVLHICASKNHVKAAKFLVNLLPNEVLYRYSIFQCLQITQPFSFQNTFSGLTKLASLLYTFQLLIAISKLRKNWSKCKKV